LKYSDFKKMCAEALLDFGMHSDNCVELLAMICAHESLGGKYRKQIGGIALGIFQIEPATHNSIWDNSDTIKSRAMRLGIKEDVNRLETDDRYSIFVARHYLAQDVNPLPKTIDDMAKYCKSYWNRTGKATPEKYLNDYLRWRDESSSASDR
jgi:hypothetical protein